MLDMTMTHLLFGKLSWGAIPFDQPIIMGAGGVMGLASIVIVGAIFYFKKWTYLWKEWLTTVDHKKIGIMYLILGFVMLLRGFSDALLIRSQQFLASTGDHLGYLPPEHFNQVFTAHGVIMIFFVAMTLTFGFVNLIVPLQIGARDVAYPYLNSLSFWMTTAASGLVLVSLVVGDFAKTGWLAYPPLSGNLYSPGVGMDYYLWALTISGIATLIGGINILVTIIKMRCPGMTLMKMPLFTWSSLCSMILVVISFPVLNMTLFLLFLDRYFDMHFFTSAHGGNPMMYINLIWTWGHPEVYILVLPAFGMYSEIVSTFCKKQIFGYAAMVWATAAITLLSFTVWLHHFFTMGAGANVNAVFGIATMIISIPTGVKVFNWLATMYRGRITFSTPMMWMMAFLVTFTIGGMTGVLMSVPGVDFIVHNSVFLVAHFHNTIIGGVVFGLFAGFTFWFPKMFGYKLNERLGRYVFWCWVPGFFLAFMPLYALGLMGMTRRMDQHIPAIFHVYLGVAACGALLILLGVVFQILQLVMSIKQRDQNRDMTGDAWGDGRTLEWSIPSPAPFYNFAIEPTVHSRDAFWEAKQAGVVPSKNYTDIHMPKDTSMGFVIGVVSGVFGFGMVWEMPLLSAVSGAGILFLVIARTFNFKTDYYVPAAEVARIENLARGVQ